MAQHTISVTRDETEPSPAPGRVREAARFTGMVLAAMVLLAAVFVLAAAVVVPRVAGATPYTILTGSMSPAYPPGTLVVAQPTDPADIALGAVITYQITSGQPALATHRVVAIARHPDGGVRFQTKGDANNGPDVAWVRPEQVRGVLWYAVPGLGRAGALLTGEQRERGVQAVAVLLLGYAGVSFFRSARQRARRSA